MPSPTLLIHLEEWKKSRLAYSPGCKITTTDAYSDFMKWSFGRFGRCGWGRREFSNGLVGIGYELGKSTAGKRVIRHWELAST